MKRVLILAVAVCACAVQEVTTFAAADASREARFANPPATARILPIHHDRPPGGAKGAERELAALRAGGFGGVVANIAFSNYLNSAEAWQDVKCLVDKAHEQGMPVWIYDERGYPSGTAGGRTLAGHPEWRARAYLIAVTNVPTGSAALPPSPPGRPVATLRRKGGDGKTERVYVVTDDYIHEGTHAATSVSRFQCAYPNLLMAEPTARFIELTHEGYRRALGPSLKYVSSTFTDEPSLMTYWMRPMPYYCLPVSDELLAAYEKAAGRPLAEDVPALLEGTAKGATAAVRHRFWSMVGDRVARNYTGQLTRWADANGVASGGHLLAEETLEAHVPLYGDFFKVLRRLSAPSCDMLHSIPSKVAWLTPQLAGSAGALNGARYVMSETSDHCQQYRRAGDTTPVYMVNLREIVGTFNRQIWGGVNTFTSYYGWGRFTLAERRALNEEIGRALTLMQEGQAAAEIALLYPSDALMVGFEPQLRGGGGEAASRTAGFVYRVNGALFKAGRAALFVDDETLAAAEVRDGMLVKGDLRWRTIVLPGVSTLSIEAARKLEAFRKAGGLLVAVGERPSNSRTAFPDGEMARLTAEWGLVTGRQEKLLADLIDARHEPALRCVRGKAGVVRVAHRRTKTAGDVFFVLNDSGEPWSGAVRLRESVRTRVWNPRVGCSLEGRGDIPLDLPPFGAMLLTTETPVEGCLKAGVNASFDPVIRPMTAPVKTVSFSRGTHVQGGETALSNGWRRVDVALTKGNVDTYAFLARAYDRSPIPRGGRGVAFEVRVPETTGGHVRGGVFLTTADGEQWFMSAPVSLSRKGKTTVSCAFVEFVRHGMPKGMKAGVLRAEDIRQIKFGFGGYFGKEGERVRFEVSEPKALMFAEAGED